MLAQSPSELPFPWQEGRDIGDVGRPGDVRVAEDGTFIIRGAGDDIWDTADAFHFLYSQIGGGDDVNLVATVTAIDGTEAWTKVGVMLRSDIVPGAKHDSVWATRGKGIAYQRRLTENGPSLHTSISASSTLPVTFEVMRRSGYTEINVIRDGVAQRAAALSSSSWNLIGLAVSSHDRTILATGTFTGVSLDTFSDPKVLMVSPEPGQQAIPAGMPFTIQWSQQSMNAATVSYTVDNGQTWTVVPGCASVTTTSCVWNDPPETEAARIRVVVNDPADRTAWAATFPFAIRSGSPTMLPQGWVSADVGAVGATGSAAYAPQTGQFTVAGSGADIWGTDDEFQFVSRTVTGEPELGVEFTARVASVENVNRWTKAGIMMRANRGAGAAHISAFVTPSTLKGVAFQHRPFDGAVSGHTAGPAITAPVWLKFIARNGEVRAYSRQAAADEWTYLGQERVAMGIPYEAGLAVSSHVDGTLARATFDNVSFWARDALFGHEDIGATRIPGATGINDIERQLWGSGADIWGTADAFRYNYGTISSTGVITASVRRIQHTDPWAKAGVMIRTDTSPGSPHVMLIVSAERGLAMQYRPVANGPSGNIVVVPGAAPSWLRLRRQGTIIHGEVSYDGVTWQIFADIDLPLGDEVTAGLVVTSHNNSRLASAVFQDVVLQR